LLQSVLEVAEVAEADATGLVAELFQDIREVTDARLVNLVWRHLATDPAVFEWAWRAVRPGLKSGYLPARARQLRAQVEDSVLEWLPIKLPEPGMTSPDAAAALTVVQTYSHTNCLNMMALTWLLGPASASPPKDLRQAADHATKWTPPLLEPPEPTELPDLPRLPAWQQLDAGTLLEIQQLNLMGESEAPRVVASLYRHLALWPPVLAMAAQALAPLQQAGLLLAERIATAQRADALLDQTLPAPRPAPAAFNAQFAPFLRQLRSVTIAKMIPIGCLLQQLLQQHCDAARPAVQFHVSPAESITANKPQV
jgi:hypothetical protein